MDNTQDKPAKPALTPQQISWYSDCIIVTCTEGGEYTRDDYKNWTKYKHSGENNRSEVTLVPNLDAIDEHSFVQNEDQIRVTPEWLHQRFSDELIKLINGQSKLSAHWVGPLAKAIAGDEDFIPDVVEAGALLQIAVYGEVVYG